MNRSIDELLALSCARGPVSLGRLGGELAELKASAISVQGGLVVSDPFDLEFVPFVADFPDGEYGVRFGTVRVTPDDRFRHPQRLGPFVATAIVGDEHEVVEWLPDAGNLSVDSRCGFLVSRDRLDEASAAFETVDEFDGMFSRGVENGYVYLEGCESSAVMFICALGDGEYPIHLGIDSEGATTAMLIDLEGFHRLELLPRL